MSGVVTSIADSVVSLGCGTSVDISKGWTMVLTDTPNPRTLCQILGPETGQIRLLTEGKMAELNAQEGWKAWAVGGDN